MGTGGRHALEEAACMQSTLYFSLHEAKRRAEEKGHRSHIPRKGAVLTPDTCVFREGTAAGYAPRRPVWLAAVVSVSMPNQNQSVHNTPVDRSVGWAYEQLLESKWAAVLLCLAKVHAEILVVPDAGCGVYKNDPSKVGRALGNALRRCPAKLNTVIIVGSYDFFVAVRDALLPSSESHARSRNISLSSLSSPSSWRRCWSSRSCGSFKGLRNNATPDEAVVKKYNAIDKDQFQSYDVTTAMATAHDDAAVLDSTYYFDYPALEAREQELAAEPECTSSLTWRSPHRSDSLPVHFESSFRLLMTCRSSPLLFCCEMGIQI